MINKGGVILFILYIILYTVFSIIFDMNNIFGYFLHILLFLVPVYLLYNSWNKDKNCNFYIILSLLAVVIIYFLQFNYLKIPEYSEGFSLKQPIIHDVKLLDCRIEICSVSDKENIIQNFLEGNIFFNAPDGFDEILNSDENIEIIKNIHFNKEEIFQNFLYNSIYYNNTHNLSLKKGVDLVFNEKEFIEYRKAYSYFIYEKIVNNNESNNIILEKFKGNNNNFLYLLLNKRNYYNSSLYSEKIMLKIWDKLETIENRINNINK